MELGEAEPRMAKIRKPKPPVEDGVLDAEPYVTMFARTSQAAWSALYQYGEPRATLEELRRMIASACPNISLSATILAERRAGW